MSFATKAIVALAASAVALAADRPNPTEADIAWIASGEFCEPETVLPLPDDTLLVSNVCDFREHGSGFLTLLDKDGNPLNWRVVDGLDAPLGMALVDRRLYVVDMNRVLVMRWPGYDLLETINLDTSVANDIAVAPDGVVYVTDTVDGKVVQRLTDGTLQITPVAGPLIRYRGDDDIEIHVGEGISSANHGYAPALQLALIPTGFDNTVIAIRLGVEPAEIQ
jgi:hypothetical protein